MGEEFFTEVPERIRFRGADADDPLAFKVYEPDRLVLGKRMEEHLRIGVCLWHSFAWPGVDMFGERDAGPPVAGRRPGPDGGGPHEDGRRVRVPRASSASRTTASTIATSPPRARSFAEFRDNLDALADDAAGLPGADRRPAPVGHRQPVHPSALPGRRRHQPGSRGLRLRGGAGQAHARGHQAPRRHQLRPVGRPRGLRHAAQHRPPARGRAARPVPAPRGRAQAQDRLRGHAADRAQADGAHQAPVRPRHRDRARLPRAARPGGRVQGQHRGQPRHARRATASTTRSRTRSPTGMLGIDRRQPRRPAERLGHRPVPELRRRPGDAAVRDPASAAGLATAASTSTPSSGARAATAPTCSTPTSAGIDTLARALLVAADLLEAGTLAATWSSSAMRAGTASWAAAILDGGLARRPRGAGRRGRDRAGAPARGRQELYENVVNRQLWPRPADGRLTPWASSSGSTSPRPRPRRSSSTRRGSVLGIASREYPFEQPHPLWSEQDPAPWWTGAVAAIRGSSPRPGRPGRRRRGGRAHRADARPGAARRGRPGDPPRHPLERPADGRGVRRASATAVGPERLIAHHRQRRADGLHGTQAGLGPRPRARGLGPRRPRAAAQGLRPAAADRGSCPRQGRRRGHAAVRPGGTRLVDR